MGIKTDHAQWTSRLRAGMTVFTVASETTADGGLPVPGFPRVTHPPRAPQRV
jgi:hypothetical protein